MPPNKRTSFSILRSVAFRCAVSIFLIGSIAADEHEVARRIAGHSTNAKIVTELHAAPVTPIPGHALREGSTENLQRIEEARTREGSNRNGIAGFCDQPEGLLYLASLATFEPESLVWAKILLPQLSFSHFELTARYPIPPPHTLL